MKIYGQTNMRVDPDFSTFRDELVDYMSEVVTQRNWTGGRFRATSK